MPSLNASAQAQGKDKTRVEKQAGRLVASDPTSPQAVLAALEAAQNWDQGKEALKQIFNALLAD
ncbi:MAG: hypothetical protein C4525_00670 [Desulfarculus sp.]|nr:MAG: hypothetical protein C4525_00670 [Desulfarculus sp.]